MPILMIIYSNTWEQHLECVCSLLLRLVEANLTVNLPKCKFRCSHIVFLGHVVGQRQDRPVDTKVRAVANYPIPSDRK